MESFYYTMKPSPRTRNFLMNFFKIFFYICNNDVKIQEHRNNTLNSSSHFNAAHVGFNSTCFFFFFQFASQFSREKVVAISNCPFVNFEINSFNSVHVLNDLFSFLSSRNCALFCSIEGINNHDFPAQHFVVKRFPYHRLPKKIRIQFKRNL